MGPRQKNTDATDSGTNRTATLRVIDVEEDDGNDAKEPPKLVVTKQPASMVTPVNGSAVLWANADTAVCTQGAGVQRYTESCSDEYTEDYITRFYVDHEKQSDDLCREIMLDDCIPCFKPRGEHTISWCILSIPWKFIRSEAFVYFLHLTAILFGVLKEIVKDLSALLYRCGIERRTKVVGTIRSDPVLTIIHCSVETGATLLLLIIRMVTSWRFRKVIKKAVEEMEYIDQKERQPHVTSTRRLIGLHTIASILLIAIAGGSFVAFFFVGNLGWTLLSNNFCMITANVLFGLLFERIMLSKVRIHEDQFRAIIFESMLLIDELHAVSEVASVEIYHSDFLPDLVSSDNQKPLNNLQKDKDNNDSSCPDKNSGAMVSTDTALRANLPSGPNTLIYNPAEEAVKRSILFIDAVNSTARFQSKKETVKVHNNCKDHVDKHDRLHRQRSEQLNQSKTEQSETNVIQGALT